MPVPHTRLRKRLAQFVQQFSLQIGFWLCSWKAGITCEILGLDGKLQLVFRWVSRPSGARLRFEQETRHFDCTCAVLGKLTNVIAPSVINFVHELLLTYNFFDNFSVSASLKFLRFDISNRRSGEYLFSYAFLANRRSSWLYNNRIKIGRRFCIDKPFWKKNTNENSRKTVSI
jgi:hypothetical protein